MARSPFCHSRTPARAVTSCSSTTSASGGGEAGAKEIRIGLLTGSPASGGLGMRQGSEFGEAGGVDGHTFRLKVPDVRNQSNDALRAERVTS